jgi:hypothetical protein
MIRARILLANDLLKLHSAVRQRQGAQVAAVEIEDVEAYRIASAPPCCLDCGYCRAYRAPVEQAEIRPALLVQHDRLAVHDKRVLAELVLRPLGDGWKAMRPVMPAARQDRRLATLDPKRKSVAVPSDLKGPALTNRLGTKQKVLGLMLRPAGSLPVIKPHAVVRRDRPVAS